MPQTVIQTLVWKRPDITRLHFDSLKQTGLDVFVGVSEPWAVGLCKEYGFRYINVPNKPLGAKKNKTIALALEYGWDYLMEIGSDDLLIQDAFQEYLENTKKGYDCFGADNIYYADTQQKKAIHHRYNGHSAIVFGGGRVTKRSLIGPGLWDDHRNKCLDNNSRQSLQKLGAEITVIDSPPIMCDFKTGVNIWGFENYDGKEIPYSDILDLFPKQKDKLKRL